MAPQDETQLRDWFAGLLMSTGNPVSSLASISGSSKADEWDELALRRAKTAYVFADAMFKARQMNETELRSF